MKVKGLFSECSKKPKSWKCVIDGHNYYSSVNVDEFVGKEIEFDYEDSKPYKNAQTGQMITSKYITQGTIKVVGGKTSPEPSRTSGNASNSHVPATNGNIPIGTDWKARNRQTDRGMLISYVCEHLVAKSLLNVDDIPKEVEKLFKLQYEIKETEEIPF